MSNNNKNNNIFKNYLSPIIFIIIVPLVLYFLLIKTNNISNLILPNQYSFVFTCLFLLYGFISLKISNKEFIGPKNVDDTTPCYTDNGFAFWIFTSIISIIYGLFNKDGVIKFGENYIPVLMTFNIIGLFLVIYLYMKDKNQYHNKEKDDEEGISGLFRFYRGLKFHPKIFGVDVKQWTNCRFGMIIWQIIIILFFFFSYHKKSKINIAILVSVILQSIYIGKFFFWETGYFNTLDITLDRAGYYICWGCLVFLPAFYTFTVYYLANQDGDIPWKIGLGILALGLYFIYKNYEVDKEKEDFKKYGEDTLINGKKAEYLNVKYQKNGEIVDSKLLLSGHWSDVRHKNYLYEILLSACWCGVGYKYGALPFLYLFYIIALLVHRTFRDEAKCKTKYGEYWEKYCNIVPFRIIKNIF